MLGYKLIVPIKVLSHLACLWSIRCLQSNLRIFLFLKGSRLQQGRRPVPISQNNKRILAIRNLLQPAQPNHSKVSSKSPDSIDPSEAIALLTRDYMNPV